MGGQVSQIVIDHYTFSNADYVAISRSPMSTAALHCQGDLLARQSRETLDILFPTNY